jgi:hypothetical protein
LIVELPGNRDGDHDKYFRQDEKKLVVPENKEGERKRDEVNDYNE